MTPRTTAHVPLPVARLMERCTPTGLAMIGIALTVASLLGFAALQYAMPDRTDRVSRPGSDAGRPRTSAAVPPGAFVEGSGPRVVAGAEHFGRHLLGSPARAMAPARFTGLFSIALTMAWIGYLLVVGAGLAGANLRVRRLLPVIGLFGVFLAIFCPPSLSIDAYSYVGFGRMYAFYGLSPYTGRLSQLGPLGDPIARFVPDGGCVYGPVWTLLSSGIVLLLRPAGLWWQVVAMKLIAAGGLVIAALAGRRIAEHFEPGRGALAMLAIGLNPLFLVEGPGNAHNDLLMMALFLAGSASLLANAEWRGALLIGLSAGIKFPILGVLPWIVLDTPGAIDRGRRLRRASAMALLALAPTILGFIPLWRGVDTFRHTMRRLLVTSGDPAQVEAVVRTDGSPAFTTALPALARQAPVVLLYIGLTAWLLRRPRRGQWLDAWVILAFALIFWTMGILFNWYLIWPWAVLLTRWDRTHRAASAACLGLAIASLFRYWDLWLS